MILTRRNQQLDLQYCYNLFHVLREVTSAEKTKYFERLTEDYFNFCSYYNTIVTIGNNLDYYMNCRNNSIENEMSKLRNKSNNDLMNKENIIDELKERLTLAFQFLES